MKKSHKVLEAFLIKHYMKSEGADDLDTAIRDCLTDLLYISKELNGNGLDARLSDAEDVYEEEKRLEQLENKA